VLKKLVGGVKSGAKKNRKEGYWMGRESLRNGGFAASSIIKKNPWTAEKGSTERGDAYGDGEGWGISYDSRSGKGTPAAPKGGLL